MPKIWSENLERQDGSDGHLQRTHSIDIELDGKTLKHVEQFKYLGSIFVREGGCKEDVKTRLLRRHRSFTNFYLF